MKRSIAAICVLAGCSGCQRSSAIDTRGEALPRNAIWVDDLDLDHMTVGRGRARSGQTIDGNPLRMGGVAFPRGVGTVADSEMTIDLHGEAIRFIADVGVDDQAGCRQSSPTYRSAGVRFRVFTDGRLVTDSGAMRHRARPQRLETDLSGVHALRLIVEKEPFAAFTAVDWGGAVIVLRSDRSARPTSTGPQPGALGEPPEAAAPAARLFDEDQTRWVETGRGPADDLWIETMDGHGSQASGIAFQHTPHGTALTLGGRRYGRGVGMSGNGSLSIDLGGAAGRFFARVGIDSGFQCEKTVPGSAARFVVWLDGRRAFDSGERRAQDDPVDVLLDLTGARSMMLATQMTGRGSLDADWAGAVLTLDPIAAVVPRIVAGNQVP